MGEGGVMGTTMRYKDEMSQQWSVSIESVECVSHCCHKQQPNYHHINGDEREGFYARSEESKKISIKHSMHTFERSSFSNPSIGVLFPSFPSSRPCPSNPFKLLCSTSFVVIVFCRLAVAVRARKLIGVHEQTDACNSKRMDKCVLVHLSAFSLALWPRDHVSTRTIAQQTQHAARNRITLSSLIMLLFFLLKFKALTADIDNVTLFWFPSPPRFSISLSSHFFSIPPSIRPFLRSFFACPSLASLPIPPSLRFFFPFSWYMQLSVLPFLIPFTTFCTSAFSFPHSFKFFIP